MINYSALPELLKAIDNDWAVCDYSDSHEHMTLVNADREEHPTLRPPKALIEELEAEGLVRFDAERSTPKGTQREYMEFLDITVPEPFVYFFLLTNSGRDFLKHGKQKPLHYPYGIS